MDKLLKNMRYGVRNRILNGDCFYKIRDNKSQCSALVLNIPRETELKPGEYVAIAKSDDGIIKLIPKKLFKRSDYET
jgi:hypothetical protein